MNRVFGISVGSVLLATALCAQDRGQQGTKKDGDEPSRHQLRDARSFRRLEVSGEEVSKNVRKLTKGLKWHKSLSSALASARKQGKPVMWIQALGDLDGFL